MDMPKRFTLLVIHIDIAKLLYIDRSLFYTYVARGYIILNVSS